MISSNSIVFNNEDENKFKREIFEPKKTRLLTTSHSRTATLLLDIDGIGSFNRDWAQVYKTRFIPKRKNIDPPHLLQPARLLQVLQLQQAAARRATEASPASTRRETLEIVVYPLKLEFPNPANFRLRDVSLMTSDFPF